jgi:hypothetical protein
MGHHRLCLAIEKKIQRADAVFGAYAPPADEQRRAEADR